MTLAAILIAARGIYFIAAMLLFGGALFRALFQSRLSIEIPWRARLWIVAAAVAAACVWLVLAAEAMAGTLDVSAVTTTVTSTLFGQIFVLRLAALLGLLLLPQGWIAVAMAAVALGLPAITGHAAAASPAGFIAIGATLDAGHLLAAGLWIGGLAMLVAIRKHSGFSAALALFSDWAMVAVLLLVMTGIVNFVSVILSGPGKASPLYLTVLVAKLVGVGAMLLLAFINRFWLMPDGATNRIARNATMELALGGVVILLAAWLGQLPPTV